MVVLLMAAFLVVTSCGIAAIITGFKKIRDPSFDVHHVWWLYLGIAAAVFGGVVIFVYGP